MVNVITRTHNDGHIEKTVSCYEAILAKIIVEKGKQKLVHEPVYVHAEEWDMGRNYVTYFSSASYPKNQYFDRYHNVRHRAFLILHNFNDPYTFISPFEDIKNYHHKEMDIHYKELYQQECQCAHWIGRSDLINSRYQREDCLVCKGKLHSLSERLFRSCEELIKGTEFKSKALERYDVRFEIFRKGFYSIGNEKISINNRPYSSDLIEEEAQLLLEYGRMIREEKVEEGDWHWLPIEEYWDYIDTHLMNVSKMNRYLSATHYNSDWFYCHHDTVHNLCGPYEYHYADIHVTDYRNSRLLNPIYLGPVSDNPYHLDDPSEEFPLRLKANGNDDTSYSKFFANEGDLREELFWIKVLSRLKTLDVIADLGHKNLWIFTN